MVMQQKIAVWLYLSACLVFVLVLVGGVTRRTVSGRSIVEWRPVTGIIPPLNEAAWMMELAKYQSTPQYHKLNFGMSLNEFKEIFWWEYIHRLLGRFLGLFFLLPYLYFCAVKAFTKGQKLQIGGIFLLICLQGVLGWVMVASGLKDNPYVSHYKLALHLGLAVVILWLMLIQALRIQANIRGLSAYDIKVKGVISCIPAVIFLQIALGGLAAGIHAGLVYNTFPTMDGYWIPPEVKSSLSNLSGVLENPASVQFIHRVFAGVILIMVLWNLFSALRSREKPRIVMGIILVGVTLLQVILGVLTVLHQADIKHASPHQAVAILLFAFSLIAAHGNIFIKSDGYTNRSTTS